VSGSHGVSHGQLSRNQKRKVAVYLNGQGYLVVSQMVFGLVQVMWQALVRMCDSSRKRAGGKLTEYLYLSQPNGDSGIGM
jgi:hypothetical protein